MSDSDSELLTTNNAFTFRNKSETISAQGPGINVRGMNIQDNNVTTSMLNVPRHDWRLRRPGSSYDQRSIGFRRETSPLSSASARDARQRNFNGSYYARVSAQRSVYNDRAGSPMSIRSMDSNATDIAMALKNGQFNNNETMILLEACNGFIKQKSNRRKQIEKRRNFRLLKQMRSCNKQKSEYDSKSGFDSKSGYDSGELGSNSAISSDDNRSIRTTTYKSNKSGYISNISNLRRIIKESNVTQDRSDEFRQNRMSRMAVESAYLNSSKASVTSSRSVIEKPRFTKLMPTINFNMTQNQNATTQKERFKNGFLLPSHRFNRSVAATSIPEGAEKPHCIETESEDEEIFTERTRKNRLKRGIDTVDDISMSSQKKARVVSPCSQKTDVSPCKNMTQSFRSSTIIETKNYIDFAKPAIPVKKAANIKAKAKLISESVNINTTEKLISSSRLPMSDTIESSVPKPTQTISQSKEAVEKEDPEYDTLTSQSLTDLSMRPSFIKRKLFTQNMNVTEKRQDVANSPQNSIYGAIQKEKNKARKLATSQYCLRRDIQADESNLLDLIHKIIPAEQMNTTALTTKTLQNKSQVDNWDLSSIISAKNNDDNMSDTFTDEDTLRPDARTQLALHETLKSPPKKVLEKRSVDGNNDVAMKVAKQVVATKSPAKFTQVMQKILAEKNGTPVKRVDKAFKSFWDTDFESDAEGSMVRKDDSKENKKIDAQHNNMETQYRGFPRTLLLNKTSAVNDTITFNSTIDKVSFINRDFKLCLHRITKPHTKKAENLKEDIRSQKHNLQAIKASSCINLSKQDHNEQSKIDVKKNLKPSTKKLTPKKRKTTKEKCENTSPVSIVKEVDKSQRKTITKVCLSMQDDVEQTMDKQENNKTTRRLRKTTKEINCKASKATTEKELVIPQKETNCKASKAITEKELAIPQKKTLKADKKSEPLSDKTVNTVVMAKSQNTKDIKKCQRKSKTNKKLPISKEDEDETHKIDTQKNKNNEIAQTLTIKQTVSSKRQDKKAENKNLKTTAYKANTTQNATSIITNQITRSHPGNNLSFTENDSNLSPRPLRSCQISNLNITQRSLRSFDSYSSTAVDSIKKDKLPTKQSKKTTKNSAQNKPVVKKVVNKLQQNLEESDISFSITKDSPSPKRKLYNTRLQSTLESDVSILY